ncbi:MAG: cysteine-rich CWC family protein [Crocinitomicaceae bacterium]|nr:cysteine-rich CWC family protein [Crocinitomicaceae bacterium]
MQKTCQLCHNEFECNAEAITTCFCNNLQIPENTKMKLGIISTDCICEQCIQRLIIEENTKNNQLKD